MTNNITKTNNNNQVATKQSFSSFMQNVGAKLVANTLNDKTRQNNFTANIISTVSANPQLSACDNVSILTCGLQAETLKLPMNNAFGYCYAVPYNDKKNDRKVAQFQMGYKGFIQLAIRSGYYKNISVVELREGELGKFDPLHGTTYNWIEDYEKRSKAKIIGYVASLELMSGFTKEIYWKYEEMLEHADKYSQAFDKKTYLKLMKGEPILDEFGKKIPEYKLSSFWYKNFDEMAKKTVLKQLISKWGIMSIEMQTAMTNDQATISSDGSIFYVDNQQDNKDFINTEVVEAQEQVKQNVASEQVPDFEDYNSDDVDNAIHKALESELYD